MQHEQTEIDALAALRPDVLRQIAREAVIPFHDPTLHDRTQAARDEWAAEAEAVLIKDPAYPAAVAEIGNALASLQTAANELQDAQRHALAALRNVDPPEVVLPEAELYEEAPRPLFTTEDSFEEATRRLKDHKRLI